MTNTRITDPEILERRYPVMLRRYLSICHIALLILIFALRFGLRELSGGEGQYVGGDGVVREMEFLRVIIIR
jgi:5-oxoprolinase (ATP-hydrolysing)